MQTTQQRAVRIVATIIGLLMVPLVAMQFTNQVNWTLSDFIIAAILLSAAGFGFELIMRAEGSGRRRIVRLLVLLLVFLYVWAELAVGIFNIPGISGS